MEFNQSFFQQKLKSGIEFFNKNKLDEAIECFKFLENEKSTQIIAFLYLGIIEIKKKNNENAKNFFFKILEIDKNHEFANLNLGLVFFQDKDVKKTIDYLNKTLNINQENLLAKYHLGLIDMMNKKYEKAKKKFEDILLKEPKNLSALNNLGICYLKEINFKKAINLFKQCLNINNKNRQAILNLANCLFQIKDFENSIINYNKVLDIDKDHTIAKIGLSKCYFAINNYDKAFYFFEARKKAQLDNLKITNKLVKDFNCKEWFKEKIDNKKILILSEQGIGDNLQFARYIFWLKEKYNCEILFYINKKISHIFQNCPCKIINDFTQIENLDYYQHLLTLQYIHYKIENNFKKCIPFITSNNEIDLNWKNKLKFFKRPLIAIQWKGNENFLDDQQRSVPLKFFQDLIKDNNYTFISLQKDNLSKEIKLNNFDNYIKDFSDEIDLKGESFIDTISILKNIDLLISVDTSMTHLAATLQVKTLLLLNSNPDWRWHIEFKEKCFYENLEIIRLNKANDWNSITSLISLKLREIFR